VGRGWEEGPCDYPQKSHNGPLFVPLRYLQSAGPPRISQRAVSNVSLPPPSFSSFAFCINAEILTILNGSSRRTPACAFSPAPAFRRRLGGGGRRREPLSGVQFPPPALQLEPTSGGRPAGLAAPAALPQLPRPSCAPARGPSLELNTSEKG
jgi:hypothetical protein